VNQKILGSESESLDVQHKYCPKSSTSWCRFQTDKMNKTSTYDQSRCLPHVFRAELKPIFDRLASQDLLQRCLKGFTQNQNEALNNILWLKCPKRVFCGKTKLQTAAAQAIVTWNMGSAGQGTILNKLGLNDLGFHTLAGFQKENNIRIKFLPATESSVKSFGLRGRKARAQASHTNLVPLPPKRFQIKLLGQWHRKVQRERKEMKAKKHQSLKALNLPYKFASRS